MCQRQGMLWMISFIGPTLWLALFGTSSVLARPFCESMPSGGQLTEIHQPDKWESKQINHVNLLKPWKEREALWVALYLNDLDLEHQKRQRSWAHSQLNSRGCKLQEWWKISEMCLVMSWRKPVKWYTALIHVPCLLPLPPPQPGSEGDVEVNSSVATGLYRERGWHCAKKGHNYGVPKANGEGPIVAVPKPDGNMFFHRLPESECNHKIQHVSNASLWWNDRGKSSRSNAYEC